MVSKLKTITTCILVLVALAGNTQDLEDLLNAETEQPPQFAEATFKGTRLVNGHTVITRDRGVLDFLISHRFGRLNSGAYNFFGLDQANIRLGLEYGVTDRLNVGVGRNSFEKTFDGFIKYQVVRQSLDQGSPVTITAIVTGSIKTQRDFVPNAEIQFSNRLAYSYQALIARKFSPAFSLQLMPTFVHRNLVLTTEEENNTFAMGAGGRIKLTPSVALNVEYYYRFDEYPDTYHNAAAIGFDIETGGHVFQLHLTNSRTVNNKGFITETTGELEKGDIHFGFNISRVFQLGSR